MSRRPACERWPVAPAILSAECDVLAISRPGGTNHVPSFQASAEWALRGYARGSFGLYNTREEVDALVEGIQKVREVFA